jgi:hypothetical protein
MKHTLGNSRPHLAHKLLRDKLYGEICGAHEAEAGLFVGYAKLTGFIIATALFAHGGMVPVLPRVICDRQD